MKRLLMLNPTLCVGGVERKIADIAQYISQHDNLNLRADLILEEPLPVNSPEDIFLERVAQSPLHIHFKPATRFLSFFFYLFYQVLRLKPDIILAFSRRPSILALTLRELLWWHKPRVVLGNDSIASHDLNLYVRNPITQRILKKQMQLLYPRAALILAPSTSSERDLIENFRVAPEKIRVLKNWTLHAPPQNTSTTFDLIYVGRVVPVKQLTRLVQIVQQVRQTMAQLRVVIVGDGDDMDNVKRATRAYQLENHIEFVGFQENIGAYLARSKIFCLTSQFEGLPIAGLEAMAYGLPIVTLAYDGASELVQNNYNGFVCTSDQEFCDAILRLLGNDELRGQMGAHAREFVQRVHGETVLAQYIHLVLDSPQ